MNSTKNEDFDELASISEILPYQAQLEEDQPKIILPDNSQTTERVVDHNEILKQLKSLQDQLTQRKTEKAKKSKKRKEKKERRIQPPKTYRKRFLLPK